ncbi:hypothetical protein DICVIV_02817 [Dictyocaulus viviparus]|uniref:Uncharacterized protein n=1 Tax=Dictyocaulus viviparus TaxID=29172 RepID=A0A0D8Y8Y9_DICVI|nr:hypothetical protein DICVIV_02817 [Dictyocaulus viviparus]
MDGELQCTTATLQENVHQYENKDLQNTSEITTVELCVQLSMNFVKLLMVGVTNIITIVITKLETYGQGGSESHYSLSSSSTNNAATTTACASHDR